MSKKARGFVLALAITCLLTSTVGTHFIGPDGLMALSVSAATAKLEITTQPKSVTVAKGKTATVKVAASGSGLTYKWYYKNAGSSKFTLSSTVKGNTYDAKMSASRHNRQLYCVITDKAGNTVTTQTVTIFMSGAPKITTQPKSVTVAKGKTATVKVAASGSGLTYKWYYKNAGSSKFTLSTTVKGNTYAVEMNAQRDGRQLYCVITDKAGNTVTTETVTISMSSAPKITTQPKSVTVANGKTATVKVAASGSGLTYKWYYKNAGSSKFTLSSTVKGNTYDAKMSASRHNRQLYCVITDKAGNTVTTQTVTISMSGAAKITTQPKSVTVAKGKTATVKVEASGSGLTYKWYYKNAGSSKFTLSTTVKGNTYAVEMNAQRDGRQLYCVITDKYGTSVQSNTVTIKATVSLAITKQPASVVVKNGNNICISLAAKGEGLKYTWYYKNKGASKFSKTDSFTGTEYTATMSAQRDGRQVYCVVTDKYGNSVQSNVVTMYMGTPAAITKQPVSVTAKNGETARVTVSAVGEGLTYKWYYKDANASSFKLTTTFTGGSYSAVMNDNRNGRQLYCVITDKYGFSVQTKTVSLTMAAPYHITVDLGYGEPYVVDVKADGVYKLSKPSRVGYGFEGWKTAAGKDFPASGTIDKDVLIKATWKVAGTDTLQELINRTNGGASEIVITGNIVINQPIYISYETRIYSNKNYTLTRDPNYNGDLFVVGKDANGVSSLLHHRKASLTLGGGKGTLTIDGNRSNAKVNVVGSAIFVGDSSTLNIYDGVKICNNQKLGNRRILTYIGSIEESTATRAGGAAILNINSVVNMYGGIIENNAVKIEHTITTDDQGAETKNETAGCGGAIFNNGSFYMSGGTIRNNEALRGGAVYIMKPTTIEAGTIQGNKSYTYGGAISTSASMYANLYVGSEGTGKTVLIKNNYSVSAGGALYSNTTSPIIILGNTVFEGNSTGYSGGAIYTGGSLTIRNTTFRGNTSPYSGGAVFFHNTKDSSWTVRRAEITDCVFESNQGSLGGAITFSRSNKDDPKATGVIATVTNCRFIKNEAIKNDNNPGNGGAMYVTQLADATISGCEFSGNIAASSGGAVSVNGQANAKLNNNTFTGNTAVNGGALYLSIDTTNTLKNLVFTENRAVASASGSGGTGGAIYAYSTNVSVEKLDIRNNSAAQHAGAIYMSATTLTLGNDTTIEGNVAGDHGGAFYLTYTSNEDGTKNGSKLILNKTELKGNAAKVGGAISIRTDCEATLNNAKLVENTASASADDQMGGGAVYVGYGKLTVSNTTLDSNTSAYYGGAIYSRKSPVTINGGTVKNSVGATGAALYFCEGTTATLKDVTVTDNNASYNGVVYINGGKLDMTNVTASGNVANQGGVLYTSGAATVVTLRDSTWSDNSAGTGGAIYMANATVNVANSTMSKNTAKLGGSIYNKLGTLTTDGVTFSENSATMTASGGSGNGGAVVLVGGNYTASAKDSFRNNTAENHAGAIYVSYFEDPDTKVRTGGILAVPEATFSGNTAVGGGAVSIRTDGQATFEGTIFTDNKVTGDDGKADGYGEGGGAIYVGYGKLTAKNITATGNTSTTYGGAIHILDSAATVTGSNISENQSKHGGAIYIMGTKPVSVIDSTLNKNTATGNAGAIYASTEVVAELKNLTLAENHANGHAGALYINDANMATESLTMTGNSAGSNGGAVYLIGREMTVTSKDVFKNNSAGGHGGAFYVVYKTNADNTRTGAVLNANGTLFEGNTAMAGGAISVRSASTANLNGATLLNNAVTGFQDDGDETTTNDNDGDGEGGGAIYVGYGTVNLTNVTASGNTASDFGGVVDAVSSPVSIIGGTYSGNTSNTGGVLHAMSKSTITVNGAQFTNNQSLAKNEGYNADIGGGVFHTVDGTLHITASTLDNNSSANYGGVILANKTAITIDGATVFSNNTGATGVIAHVRSAKMTLDNVSITDNTSSTNGILYYAGGELTISNVNATGNKAYQGGVLFINGTKATITNSSFSGNQATNGGVLYSKGSGTVGIENCTLTENTGSYGGAVHLIENSKLNLTGTTFTKNSATKDGGAIYNKASTVTAIDTETAKNVFTENSATSHGGAIYVVYSTDEATQVKTPGVLTVTGGTFTDNTAVGGGAVSVRTSCEASFDGTTFTGNEVSGDDGKVDGYSEGGGAVYVGYGKLTMNNVTASENISENYGGMAHLLDTEATITNSTFTENEAGDGGAIWTKDGGALILTNSTFTGNKATASAGAVYVAKSITGELKNLVFNGNTAGTNAGALYLHESAVTTAKLDMQNNAATGNGGAVYLNAVVLNVTADDVFKGNSADGHGGAVYLTYNSDKVGASLIGTNAVFENNTAKAGGAISSRSYCNVELTGGALRNNKSTAPQSDKDRLGGGAIYTNTNTLKLHGVTVENNTCEYYGGAIFASDAAVTIDEKSVLKGNGAITGVALYLYSSGSATLNDVTVTENIYTKGSSNGVIYASGSVALDVEKVTATNNKSVNGGVFYCSGTVSGTIKDSVFTGNIATGNGGVIDFRSSGTLDITGCTITKNTAKNGGAIYCENGTINVNDPLTENTATASGGAISVAGKGVVNVLATATLSANSAPIGGAVYLDMGGTANINGATLENNKAEKGNGGAIAATDKSTETPAPVTLNITNATLKNNTARYGGAVYMDKAATATVTGGNFINNTAELGGAIYNIQATLNLENATFTANHATTNGGAIDTVGGAVNGVADFDENSAVGHGGAIYVAYVKGTDGAANINGVVNLTGGSFTNNTAVAGGAVSVRTGCSGIFEDVSFTGNSVSGFQDANDDTPEDDNDGDGEGGGAIYVGYGTVTLTNVTATGNTSTDSYGGFLDSVQGVVNISGGTYSGNTAPAGGVIHSIYNSKITIDGAQITDNESTFANPYMVEGTETLDNKKGGGAIAITKGTLTISGTTLDGNKSSYYGGTIMAGGATVIIKDTSVISGSIGKTGSAIYLRDTCNTTIENSTIKENLGGGTGTIYLNSGRLEMKNVTATGNQATNGAVIYASGASAQVTVTGGTYRGNSADAGAAIYNNKGVVTVNGATFTENSANLGGAIYIGQGTTTVENSTFHKNTAVKTASGSSGNGGAISMGSGTLTGTGTNVFTENTAENHGGAIYVSYVTVNSVQQGGVLNMTGGTFEGNSAPCGGAISSRTAGSVTLTGTLLKNNAATASSTNSQGGAIYTNNGTLTLSGVTLDSNTTNYYGAAVYSSDSVFTATNNCVVQNNTGITGAALWLSIPEGQTATITDMTLYKNLRNAGSANGTIYAKGNGTLAISGLTASENESTNGGVLFTSGNLTITLKDSVISDNTALTVGGVVAYRGGKTMEISGCTITGNTAPNGGVIEASGTGTLTVKSSTLEGNSATKYGGAIYVSGTGKVVVSDDTVVKDNTATAGGAVYLDLGATATITGSTFDGNEATANEGGAIMVADTTETDPQAQTKLVMSGTTLKNNKAKTRGGALATDYNSPAIMIDVQNCTFENNSAPTSGGAVCIQNCNCNSATDPTEVKIVFTNCTFTGNSSSLGAALDIRSGSCLKIDGITATQNTATDGAAVVYVTSNNSRLYITGNVVAENNVANTGAFATLAKNSGYSNPPKIYTTHANTAAWYADVAGNRSNVVFNLTTLP